jgi:hypothetical protein
MTHITTQIRSGPARHTGPAVLRVYEDAGRGVVRPQHRFGNYVPSCAQVRYAFPVALFTSAQLVAYVRSRQARGESLRAIGADFGVSQVAVGQWLRGARQPSKTVLILAGLLARADAGAWPL